MILFMFVLTTLIACGDETGSNENNEPENDIEANNGDNNSNEVDSDLNEFDPDEELTLTFVAPWSDQQVEVRFADDFNEVYPNITIDPIVEWTNTETFEELFAKQIIPDVYLVLGDFEELEELDMLYPLDELVEKHGLDLDKFREGAIDAIRSRDPKGENRLLGLPIEDVVVSLFYNKEIFDRFGKDYPTDDITWDELLKLATEVTGEMDGTQYFGLETHSLSQAILQLSVTGTDPETGEVLIRDKPEYTQYFNLIKDVLDLPGNYPDDPEEKAGLEGGNVAMDLRAVSNIPVFLGTDGLDFDMVSFPSWSDKPGVLPNNLPLTLAISPHSENIEAAFKLLEFVTTKEQQINMAQAGVAPVLDDPEVYSYLAYQDGERIEGLNIEGILSGTPAEPAEYSKYGPDVLMYGGNFIGTMTSEFVEKYRETGIDVNTFIREMHEEYEIVLEEREQQD